MTSPRVAWSTSSRVILSRIILGMPAIAPMTGSRCNEMLREWLGGGVDRWLVEPALAER